jgi:hypothetical protein
MDRRLAAAFSFALVAFACYAAVEIPRLASYRLLFRFLVHAIA